MEIDFKKFNQDQKEIIFSGIEKGLDVSIYAKPEFNAKQMYEIRLGLEEGLDVSIYAKPEFHYRQMWQIRLGLEKGLNVGIYAKPEFNWKQMEEIRFGLMSGLDVSKYADPRFDWRQMEEIRLGLEAGLDVSAYARPEFSWEKMRKIRERLEYNIFYDFSYDEEEEIVSLVIKIYDKDWNIVFSQIWDEFCINSFKAYDDFEDFYIYRKDFFVKNDWSNQRNILRAKLLSWFVYLKEKDFYIEDPVYNLEGKLVKETVKFKLPSVEDFLKKRKCFKCFSDSIFLVINQDKNKEEITLGCKKCGCKVNFWKVK